MPSSSARFTQLPRAADKVPFYIALKKLRDYLRGLIPEPAESEVTFPEVSFRIIPRTERPDYVGPPPSVGDGGTGKKTSPRKKRRSDVSVTQQSMNDDSLSQFSSAASDAPAQLSFDSQVATPLPSLTAQLHSAAHAHLPALNGGQSHNSISSEHVQSAPSSCSITELPDILSAFSPSAMSFGLAQSASMHSSGYESIPESPGSKVDSSASGLPQTPVTNGNGTALQVKDTALPVLQDLSGDSLFDLLDLPEIDLNASVQSPLLPKLEPEEFSASHQNGSNNPAPTLKHNFDMNLASNHASSNVQPVATPEHFNNYRFVSPPQSHQSPSPHLSAAFNTALAPRPMLTSTPTRGTSPQQPYVHPPYDPMNSPISPYFSPHFAARRAGAYQGHPNRFGFAQAHHQTQATQQQQQQQQQHHSYHNGYPPPPPYRHPFWNSY